MSRWGNDPTPLDDVGREEEEVEGQWELDPNDPAHPDHDLSLAHGYSDWEPARQTFLARPGVVFILTVIVIIALLVPIFYYVF
jgi:hypothetical protein